MKRYEKFDKETIINQMLVDGGCDRCILSREECEGISAMSCTEAIAQYLLQEIETVPRCHTFQTVGDYVRAVNEWTKTDNGLLIAEYMMEKIEK